MTGEADIDAAKELNRKILALAREHDHQGLLELDADPETGRLLELLPEGMSGAATTHLQGARVWRRRKEEANVRRLDEARDALAAFDLERARSLLLRVENAFLTTETFADRDRLLLDFEARSMENEELQNSASEILEEHLPRWRRWFRRRRS